MTPAADFVRRFGQWSLFAAHTPVFVTHHGRPTHVLLSIDAYTRLDRAPGQDRDPASTLLDWIDQGVILCDADYRVRHLNPAALGLLRRSDDEPLVGRDLWTACPEIRDTLVGTLIYRTMSSGEATTAVVPSAFRSSCWLRADVRATDDGVAILLRDVTIEIDALRAADTRRALATAVERHPAAGHVLLSPRGLVERADAASCAMVGLPAERVVGVAFADLVERRARAAFREAMEAALAGDDAGACDIALLANDGGIVPVTASIAEVRGAYGSNGTMLLLVPRPAG